jgi:hypothetical protein
MLCHTTADSIAKATAKAMLACPDLPKALERAANADNAASAKAILAIAKELVDILKYHVDNAYFDAVREAKADEEAPAPLLRVVR